VITLIYSEGVAIHCRDGYRVAVNYTSNEYVLDIPVNALILPGDRILQSPGITSWKE